MKCLTENASLIIHVEEGVKHTYSHLDKTVPPDDLLVQITELRFARPSLKIVVLTLLGKLRNLKYLSFYTHTQEEFHLLVDLLNNNLQITKLEIGCMYIEMRMKTFNDALGRLKHLRHLSTSGIVSIDVSKLHSLVSLEGAPSSLSSMNGFVHLERLNLQYNLSLSNSLELIRSCEKLQEVTYYSNPLTENEIDALEVNCQRNRTRRFVMRCLFLIAKQGNRDVIHEIIKNLRI